MGSLFHREGDRCRAHAACGERYRHRHRHTAPRQWCTPEQAAALFGALDRLDPRARAVYVWNEVSIGMAWAAQRGPADDALIYGQRSPAAPTDENDNIYFLNRGHQTVMAFGPGGNFVRASAECATDGARVVGVGHLRSTGTATCGWSRGSTNASSSSVRRWNRRWCRSARRQYQ